MSLHKYANMYTYLEAHTKYYFITVSFLVQLSTTCCVPNHILLYVVVSDLQLVRCKTVKSNRIDLLKLALHSHYKTSW